MVDAIIIDDLASPRLSAEQWAALVWGDANPVSLTEKAVLDAARERTGLADFGSDDFRERLGLLLDEWNNDAALTNLGRQTLFGYLVRYASNRLLIHDILKRNPIIHNEVIDRPIIITGLPRSGTTHLVNLIAADSRLQSLPLWESYEPVPNPTEAPLPDGGDPRYERCAATWAQMQVATPLLAAMHPMHPDHIHEELELMGPDFASYNFEWLAQSPRWRDHYYATDQAPHYAYLKTVLKLLQWRHGAKRWVLKCPQHLEQLPVLKRVFPDAILGITHRDPVAVIQSAVTMQAYGQRLQCKRIDPDFLIGYWSDRVEHLLRACIADRHLWPADQSTDIPFHAFMADDMAVIEQLYAKAELPLDDRARSEIAAYVKSHPRGKEGRIVYDLEGDFGTRPDDLRKRFQFYFDAFPVKAEKP
jgi:Sulfotransferase family